MNTTIASQTNLTVSVDLGFRPNDPEWREIHRASGSSPFLAWEWQSTWNRAFGDKSSVFIVRTYRDGRLVGILPLRSTKKKFLGARITRLGFVGDDVAGADYLDLIAAPADRAEVLKASLGFLRSSGSFDVLSLDNMASGSKVAALLRELGKNGDLGGASFGETTTAVCPRVDISGGWPEVLKQSRRASNFKRRLKQLEKQSGFEFRSVIDPDGIEAAFERFLRLHQLRWVDGGSELSGHPRLIAFHRELMEAMAGTGFLRFEELWVDGACRSSVYGLDDGRKFYYYNSGYDPNWAQYSVGLVLIGLSIKAAIERGNVIYDFLRGDEAYKFDWATTTEELVSITVVRKSLAANALVRNERLIEKLRDRSRTMLPTNVTEMLKSWRRKLKRNSRLAEVKNTEEAANV